MSLHSDPLSSSSDVSPTARRRGLFVTFEGIEGAGKTTQLDFAEAFLKGKGFVVRRFREPGATPLGNRVRAILLDPELTGLSPMAEFFLFCASRHQLVSSALLPALDAGEVVICDRFTDSSLAYQGYARGLPIDTVQELNRLATSGLEPDLTILLDLPPEKGLERAGSRRGQTEASDRFEAEALTFHQRVRQGFLDVARSASHRVVIIAADRAIETIRTDIENAITWALQTSSGTSGR